MKIGSNMDLKKGEYALIKVEDSADGLNTFVEVSVNKLGERNQSEEQLKIGKLSFAEAFKLCTGKNLWHKAYYSMCFDKVLDYIKENDLCIAINSKHLLGFYSEKDDSFTWKTKNVKEFFDYLEELCSNSLVLNQ